MTCYPQVYHPAKFHRPASTLAGNIPYDNLADTQTDSKRHIPSMPIGTWRMEIINSTTTAVCASVVVVAVAAAEVEVEVLQ